MLEQGEWSWSLSLPFPIQRNSFVASPVPSSFSITVTSLHWSFLFLISLEKLFFKGHPCQGLPTQATKVSG